MDARNGRKRVETARTNLDADGDWRENSRIIHTPQEVHFVAMNMRISYKVRGSEWTLLHYCSRLHSIYVRHSSSLSLCLSLSLSLSLSLFLRPRAGRFPSRLLPVAAFVALPDQPFVFDLGEPGESEERRGGKCRPAFGDGKSRFRHRRRAARHVIASEQAEQPTEPSEGTLAG